jgi:DNA mismatch repair protein MutS
MMAQYLAIKRQHPDCLLFYRMGDFYELFFDDAVKAAAALDIALTARGKHLGQDVPMCGVPVHSHESYLARLIRQGFKVALCEQTEDPKEARRRGGKAVVRREIVRVITAGTLTEDTLLDSRRNNYLAACAEAGGSLGVAWLDMSTGDFAIQPFQRREMDAVLAPGHPDPTARAVRDVESLAGPAHAAARQPVRQHQRPAPAGVSLPGRIARRLRRVLPE